MSIRTRIVKITAAATLSAAALGVVSVAPAGAVAGDPSQWGRDQAAAAQSVAEARKVNEYEGQKVNEYEGEKVNEYEGQHR